MNSISVSQSLSHNSFWFRSNQIKYDSGLNWENLSSINPFFQDLFNKDDIKRRYQLIYQKYELCFNGPLYFISKNNFYGYFEPKISTSFVGMGNEGNINHSIGISSSGIGYMNEWVMFQIMKGQENWGAGNDISLALNKESNQYDYIILFSNYGPVRVNYIHGFLETYDNSVNRYLNARGLEWTNNKNFVISISETIVYSGKNRPFDIGYLNPISSHLEVELNNRLNVTNTWNANAVWQLHLDWLVKDKSRFSFNYLIDEFTLDPKIEEGKRNSGAFSIKLSHLLFSKKEKFLTFNISKVSVGSQTFRHGLGSNNFVQSYKPLGWENGSDGDELVVGLSFLLNERIFLEIKGSNLSTKGESLISNPYQSYNYLEGLYPANRKYYAKYTSLRASIIYRMLKGIDILFDGKILNKEKPEIELKIGLAYFRF